MSTIAVVDDGRPQTLGLLDLALSLAGHQLLPVANGADAVDMGSRLVPDVGFAPGWVDGITARAIEERLEPPGRQFPWNHGSRTRQRRQKAPCEALSDDRPRNPRSQPRNRDLHRDPRAACDLA